MELKLDEQRISPSERILRLTGAVDQHTYERLEDYLKKSFAENVKLVIIECSKVDYVSSVGIGVLIWALSHAQRIGASIVLVSPSLKVRHPLEMLGVDQLIPIADTVEEAFNIARQQ